MKGQTIIWAKFLCVARTYNIMHPQWIQGKQNFIDQYSLFNDVCTWLLNDKWYWFLMFSQALCENTLTGRWIDIFLS